MPLATVETEKSQGNSVLIVLTTPPAILTAPTKAELNAGKFLTCHIYEGVPSVTPTENIGEGKRKACHRVVPQERGNVTYPGLTVEYSYLPQEMGTPGNAANLAIETLTEDAIVYGVIGDGIDGETSALTTGDVVTLLPNLECCTQARGITDSGEFGQFSVKQTLILKDGQTPLYDYVVPAA